MPRRTTPAPVDLPLIEPMLATTGPAPTGPDWVGEVKWDGARALAYIPGDGTVRLLGRRGTDYTGRFPEVATALATIPGPLILDGEIVVMGEDGWPSFAGLQRRIHLRQPTAAALSGHRALYVAFDLLHSAGGPILAQPYRERRRQLEALALDSPNVRAPAAWPTVEQAVGFTREHQLEGVIAKRLDRRYWPGARTRDWIKIKHLQSAQVTIGGWLPGPAGEVRALLVGVPVDHQLLYVGSVGSGLTETERRDLAARLQAVEAPASPFTARSLGVPRGTAVRWAQPVLVGLVTYLEVTAAGRLRQPVWKGLDPA